MIDKTGCDGVVIGRGCLGRPWLFADLAWAFAGDGRRARPTLAQVLAAMRRHIELLVEHYAASGPGDPQRRACRDIRKHVAWYLKGYVVGQDVRARLALVETLTAFDAITADLEGGQPHPGPVADGPRGRTGAARQVALPQGWLDSREIDVTSADAVRLAELSVSGG
jgi:tRNA-dihydrouridine synthase